MNLGAALGSTHELHWITWFTVYYDCNYKYSFVMFRDLLSNHCKHLWMCPGDLSEICASWGVRGSPIKMVAEMKKCEEPELTILQYAGWSSVKCNTSADILAECRHKAAASPLLLKWLVEFLDHGYHGLRSFKDLETLYWHFPSSGLLTCPRYFGEVVQDEPVVWLA